MESFAERDHRIMRSGSGALFGCLLLLTLGCGGDGDTTGPGPQLGEGDTRGSLSSGGFDRTYVLHVPPGHDPTQPAPLAIFFHGFGGSGLGFKSFITVHTLSDARGWLTVFPDGVQGSWAAGCDCTTADSAGVDDIGFVLDLISSLGQEMAIDESRIYAAGFSQGALMVHHLACELADRIAGVASVGATMLPEVAERCAPARPVPLVFIQGTADPTFPFNGVENLLLSFPATVEKWVALNGCDASAVTRELLPDVVDDGTRVQIESYPICDGGSEIISYIIDRGGHTWPSSTPALPDRFGPTSRDISASEVIVEFFARHVLN
jgi:polyhydroxybutyrate depolymerase